MKIKFLNPEFVEFMPPSLDDGVIYISMEYGTAIHNCCCGCGNRVVTPFSPTDWKLIFDGENISLHPSIGNWGFPCQSHYWIKNGKIEWSPKFSKAEITAVRDQDKYVKSQHYKVSDTHKVENIDSDAQSNKTDQSFLTRTLKMIRSFFQ